MIRFIRKLLGSPEWIVETFLDVERKARWRVRHRNGNIQLSSESYSSRFERDDSARHFAVANNMGFKALGVLLVAAVLLFAGGCTLWQHGSEMTVKGGESHSTYNSTPHAVQTEDSATESGYTLTPIPDATQHVNVSAPPGSTVTVNTSDQPKQVQVGDESVTVPPGFQLTRFFRTHRKLFEPRDELHNTADGKGPTIKGADKTLDLKNLTVPEANAAEGRTEGGGAKGIKASSWQPPIPTGKGSMIFYGLGALLLLGGVAIGYFAKNWKLGIVIMLSGGLMIGTGVAIEKYPWLFLIPLVLLAAAAVFLVFYARSHGGLSATLKSLVGGVEAAPPDAQAAVKNSIAAKAKEDEQASLVKSVVTKVKSALGLQKPPSAAAPAAAPTVAQSHASGPTA